MKKNIYILIIAIIFILNSCSKSDSASESTSDTGVGGSTARFTVVDNYLYTVDEYSLRVFNIVNPQIPEYTKKVDIGWDIETIFPNDTLLFLGSKTGMYIFDIRIPNSPVQLSKFEHVYSCDPVVVEGKYAFVTTNSDGVRCGWRNNQLMIFDISNPASPKLKNTITMSKPKGLGVDGTNLFVCDDGLKVFSIQNILSPDQKHYFKITAEDVIPYNGLLMVTGHDGIYQYKYENGNVVFLSKIAIEQELTK